MVDSPTPGLPWLDLQIHAHQPGRSATISAGQASQSVFGRSFEDVMDACQQLPRCYAEPDGSIQWSGPDWRLQVVLRDHPGGLAWCEVLGNCPLEQWTQFLRCLGWPEQELQVFDKTSQREIKLTALESRWGIDG